MCKYYIVRLLTTSKIKKNDKVRAPKVVKLSKRLIIIIIKVFIKNALRKQTCSNLHGKKMNKGKRKNT